MDPEDLITSPRFQSVFSTPPRRSTSRFASMGSTTPSTPHQSSTPGSHYATPRTTVPLSSPFEHTTTPHNHQNTPQQTPSAHSSATRNVNSSPFSPVIPIDERFGLSLAEPGLDHEPVSPMEKLRYYEMCQRTQDAEFDKTYQSLKKSGWMSDGEIRKLQKAKDENWRRWEVKVRSARREVSLSRETSASLFNFSRSLNYHPSPDSGHGSPIQRDRSNTLGTSSKNLRT